MAEAVVLGAGAWGTALAMTLASSGRATVLCVRRAAQLAAIRHSGENAAYLPGVVLPAMLQLTDRWAEAVRGAPVLVMAIPSRYARAMIAPLRDSIAPETIIVSVTKGVEEGSLKTMSQMLGEVAPPAKRTAVLSGPGFAAEIARGKPAALVAAASGEETARQVQSLFAAHALRIYRSMDMIGVELGGATKNVIAIAAGVSDGLRLGSSARAALITRGLAELMRLASAAGGNRETVAGLAGLGDLVLTCTGELSRNRSLGLAIARGERLRPSLEDGPVVEGIVNARSIKLLAERLGVEMPIVQAVYRVLYEAAPANAMVEALLSRELKAEF